VHEAIEELVAAGIRFRTTAAHASGDAQFEEAETWIGQCDAEARRREQAREDEQRRLEEERYARERAAEVRRLEEEMRIREEADEREREEERARDEQRAARLAMLEQERERSLAAFAERIDADMDEELAAPPMPIDVDALEEDIPDQTGTNPATRRRGGSDRSECNVRNYVWVRRNARRSCRVGGAGQGKWTCSFCFVPGR
jgi:flagellar biosynthesis GTPase FlhF